MKAIENAMAKLEVRHNEHIAVYGNKNEARLTGRHETGGISKFSFGVTDRVEALKSLVVAKGGKGYFEDRRPASNADPSNMTGIMVVRQTRNGPIPTHMGN